MPKIPFETLAQADSIYSAAKVETPTLFIASNASEAAHITQRLKDANIVRQIQDVDFNTTWVVAVFRGEVPSSGYGIAIREISTASGKMHLKVKLIEPDPGRYQLTMMCYPYQIVLIPRKELRVDTETIWSVYTTEGTLLVQTKYP